MRRLAFLVVSMLAVTCLGCGSGGEDAMPQADPPSVASLSPTSGAYGSEVSIVGESFGEREGVVSDFRVTFDDGIEASIVEWTSTRIRVRVPFPTQGGVVTVTTPAGSATSDESFEPDALPWALSEQAGGGFQAAGFVDDGSVAVVAAFEASRARDTRDSAVTVAMPNGSVSKFVLDKGIFREDENFNDLELLDVVATSAGLEALFYRKGSADLIHLHWKSATEPVLTEVEGATHDALLSLGHDDQGTFAWAIRAQTLVQYRPADANAGQWSESLTRALPFRVLHATRNIRAAIDETGRLHVPWGESVGNAFDEEAAPTLSSLTQNVEEDEALALGAVVDDAVIASQIAVSADASEALIVYCWTDKDFDPFEPFEPVRDGQCVGPQHLKAGQLGAPTVALNEDFQLNAVTEAGLVAVQGGEDGTWTVVGETESTELAIWPAEALTLLYHPAHGLALVVGEYGFGHVYVLRPQ